MAWMVMVLLCSMSAASVRSVDLTVQRDAMGIDVVRSVLAKIKEVDKADRITTAAEKQVIGQFIREMAYVETVDGTDYPENARDGGIWGVNRELFERTQQYNLTELFNVISTAFCINWLDVQYSELRSPLHSGLAVRVELFRLYSTNQRLYGTANDQAKANFWTTHFNGIASQWLTRTQQLRNTEGTYIITPGSSFGFFLSVSVLVSVPISLAMHKHTNGRGFNSLKGELFLF